MGALLFVRDARRLQMRLSMVGLSLRGNFYLGF